MFSELIRTLHINTDGGKNPNLFPWLLDPSCKTFFSRKMTAECFIAICFCHEPRFNSKFIKVNRSHKFNMLIKCNYFTHSLDAALQDKLCHLKRGYGLAALVSGKTWLTLKISNWKKICTIN